MSEHYAGTIEIFGSIPRLDTDGDPFIEGIKKVFGEDFDCASDEYDAFEIALEQGEVYQGTCGDLRDGEFESTEAYLIENGVNFRRTSEAYFDLPSSTVAYIDGEYYEVASDADGNSEMSVSHLRDFIESLDDLFYDRDKLPLHVNSEDDIIAFIVKKLCTEPEVKYGDVLKAWLNDLYPGIPQERPGLKYKD